MSTNKHIAKARQALIDWVAAREKLDRRLAQAYEAGLTLTEISKAVTLDRHHKASTQFVRAAANRNNVQLRLKGPRQ